MKKRIAWVGLAVVVIVAAVFFLINSDLLQKSEDETLNGFTEAFQDQNFGGLYGFVSEDAKNTYSEEDVVNRNEQIFNDLGIKNVKLENLQESEEDAGENHKKYTGDLTMDTAYGELKRDYEIQLSYNEGENDWFVEWTPDLILPGLADNQLKINSFTGARGEILDKDGEQLAFNGVKEIVGYTAGTTDEADILSLSEELEMSEESLQSVFDQEWISDGMFVAIKDAHRFTEEKKQKFSENGLSVTESPAREYALDNATYHLLGHVGEVTQEEMEAGEGYQAGDIIGKRGLEKLYEEKLRPERGYNISVVDQNGEEVESLFSKEAGDGEDVELTIDKEVQQTIYSNLEEDSGASVAMDPANGDMLATVSYPSPSPYDFMFGISQADYESLNEDEDNPLLNKFNRATSPGSTQKMLTSIIAMNSEGFDKDATKNITGKGWQKDASWGGYEVNRYHEIDGEFDLKRALIFSDNIYMAQTTLDMGAETFVQGMKDLGIGHVYDTDYPIYTSQVSNAGTIDSDILLADTAYGQGELMISPIQITSIYGGIINGGDVYIPHILKESEEKVQIENITEQANLDYLEEAMRAVVTENHPDDTERDYAEFAGKTGTSENKVSQDTRGSETGWFIGYDQNKKDMIMSLYVEDVEDRGMSEYTAGKFAEIHDDLNEE
ncbi:penicillin-binding transpeptidase domain-containing protein [Salinicoccus halodurans]|uniref:Penicillin-binding protein 2 prime/penicillin-binding protein n=1 Tax=Salinicoccus halodurans TaxID=407035 RepID=A0A0F7HMH1_9STAP|nr:penicillin-binding transpeptidase domain-containing protein [Salinicoccus halodurans]AKG74734.1 hypothetical protein AAT16_11340 [Salinicoccus halodurans]SFK87890.1 penicillin-binding protein 2 prime/penicillin-binding protein [Salinicoccus halodurans]